MMASWVASNPGLVPGFNLPTDMQTGSLERAHLEALAVVMEDYDVRADSAVDYAIDNAVFNAFGFPALSAIASSGWVVFTALVSPSSDLDVPLGTKVATTSGAQYVTIADGTIPAGSFSSAAIPVQAVIAGVAGNIAAGAICRILYPISGVDSVINSQATAGGAEAETDASRAMRFQSWVNTLVRGTKEALEYAAINVSGGSIIDALAVEPFLLTPAPASQGNVYLYLDDGLGTGTFPTINADGTFTSGGVASTSPVSANNQTLVANALNGTTNGSNGAYVPGWKGAGIQVTQKPVPRCPVQVTATVMTASTGKGRFSDIQTALANAALTYFNSVTTGQPVDYSKLRLALSVADPDIVSVSLILGVAGTTLLPGVNPSWNQNDPIQVGSRFVMENDSSFPIWSLS
jgi:hypothetical protein